MAKATKDTTKLFSFTSRYARFKITYKRGEKDPETGKVGPSEYILFENGKFETTDPDKAKFLMDAGIDGVKNYGHCYWLTEETEKYFKQFPKAIQKDKLIESQKDTIDKLKAELAAVTEAKVG